MYCGWQTRGAKIRWGAVAFLLVAFTALGIMYGVTSRDCVVCQSEGNVVDENGDTFASLHRCRDINGVSRLTGALAETPKVSDCASNCCATVARCTTWGRRRCA